ARLEADEIVFEQASHQPFVVRGCRQQVGRRKGDVQEKADTLAAAALAQLGGEWDQVIIVYPDYVVRLQEGQDGFGESLVDPPVAFQERLAEIDQVEPVMEERPQHRIGIADIICGVVFRRQRYRYLRHLADLIDLRCAGFL